MLEFDIFVSLYISIMIAILATDLIFCLSQMGRIIFIVILIVIKIAF